MRLDRQRVSHNGCCLPARQHAGQQGFPHLRCSASRVLLERFLEELVEYEQSGGTRVVDELVDMERFVVSAGPGPGCELPAEEEHEEHEIWESFGELFPQRQVPPVPTGLQAQAAAVWLVESHVRACSAKGTEIRADLGIPMTVKLTHRVSVDTRRWRWKHVLARKLKAKRHHINRLEMEAVDLALRWRLRSAKRARRFLHLVDSQVSLSVLAKGRTASPRLRPVARRIAARVLASGLVVTWGYVRSVLNPADAPSRGEQ